MVGEVSGDTLGVELMRSFKAQGIDAEFEGIGGPQMIAEGFKSYYPMETLSVMGIVEVLKDLKNFCGPRWLGTKVGREPGRCIYRHRCTRF